MHEIVPAPEGGGAFVVKEGRTEQSWVDPRDPLRLEFEYVQRIAEALEATVLQRPAEERIRVVHIGGGGLTIPRYVAARRPHSAQIVLEPDADLVDQVRTRLPLAADSGVKVRTVDGLTGITAMPDEYADAVLLDAFAQACVPGELVTVSFFAEVRRVLRPGGIFAANVTDRSPLTWARRMVAGVRDIWQNVLVSTEIPVWKGRRFGNLVILASAAVLPVAALEREAAHAAFAYRFVSGPGLADWQGGAQPFTSADAQASPPPGWAWFG